VKKGDVKVYSVAATTIEIDFSGQTGIQQNFVIIEAVSIHQDDL
jgi:hypothetical protein